MSVSNRKQFENCKEAETKGFTVVQGDPYHLLLDLDTKEQLKRYEELLPMLNTILGAEEQERWLSKSGNDHVIVKLDYPLDIVSRVALQAILGSDPKRELISIGLIHRPSALFRPIAKPSDDDIPF